LKQLNNTSDLHVYSLSLLGRGIGVLPLFRQFLGKYIVP
jgi:hypothetical protein